MHPRQIAEKLLDEAYACTQLATIYVDIDRLIIHNDCFGHVHGDATLASIRDCIKWVFRGVEHEFLRVGGDEFLIVLKGETAASAYELAESARHAVEIMTLPMVDDHYRSQQHVMTSCGDIVTISAGVMLLKGGNGLGGPGRGNWIFGSAQESVNFAKLAGCNKVVKIDLR